MKRFITILMSLILLCSTCLFSSCSADKKDAEGESEMQILKEAYTYVFPLVIMDATKTVSTNTKQPISNRAPVNQFMHADKLADADFRNVVTPNVDTIYTQAWLDLGDEPIVYVMPKADRFFKVQVMDAWSNTVTVLQDEGTYVFTLPNWDGELPDNVTRVDIPTETSWFLARIVLSGQDDLKNVYTIQKQMKMMPLSAYVKGGEYKAPLGTYSEENDFVPVEKALSMDPKTFFDTANKLMLTNPPAAEDAEILKKIAAVNVGPGMEFDVSVLGEDGIEKWKTMLQDIRTEMLSESEKFGVELGIWKYFDAPIGDFGTEYVYRALVALSGLGANTVDVAIYPKTDLDSNGDVLTGEKTYVMHFESLPPVLDDGFWSVTAYGSDDFLIDNPIDRYCVNDRTDLVFNEDGSLDVILSKEKPEDCANWLPICDDEFHLYMRIYTPDMDALAHWEAPVITAVNE